MNAYSPRVCSKSTPLEFLYSEWTLSYSPISCMIWIFGYSFFMSSSSSFSLSKNLSKSGFRQPCLNFAASCWGAMSCALSFMEDSAESTADCTRASIPFSEKSFPCAIPFLPDLYADSVAVLSNRVLRSENSPCSAVSSRFSFATRLMLYFFMPLAAKPDSILSAIFLMFFMACLLTFRLS